MRSICHMMLTLALLFSLVSCKENNQLPLKDLIFVKKETHIERNSIMPSQHLFKITDAWSSKNKWHYSEKDIERGVSYTSYSISNTTDFDDVEGVSTAIKFDDLKYSDYEIQLPVLSLHGSVQVSLTSEKNDITFLITPKYARVLFKPGDISEYFFNLPDDNHIILTIRKLGENVYVYINKYRIMVLNAKHVDFTNPTLNIKPFAKSYLDYIRYTIYEIRS